MQAKQFIQSSLSIAATLSLLVACGPPANQTVTPSPNVTASPTSSSATPTPVPSEGPSATPSVTISPSASASTGGSSPSPSSSPTSVSPSATPIPTAVPTSDISVVEKTTFNGKIYDDTNAPLDAVTVVAKSLSSSTIYQETTTTAGGAYAFNNAPAGIQIEITVSKSGYATRKRVEVLKSNKTGDPNANRYDFGTDGGDSDFGVEYNSLSDKPEVVSVTPGRNSSGISPDTSFVLKFSEPMDTDTVEQNFGVYTATDETLSVTTELFGADADLTDTDGSLVWDESAFNVSWNSDDTEVTFTFKDEQTLLTDTESENTPDYRVSLIVDDKQIKDKSGITREYDSGASDGDADAEGYFKLTSGDFEPSYKFSIDTDEDEPQLDSINALTDENGNTEGDEIEVEFSEPMVFYTEDPGEVRGFDSDEDPVNADNYFFKVNNGTELSWGQYLPEGFATFDTTDRTHNTVLLRVGVQQATPNAVVTDAEASEAINGVIGFTDGSTQTFDSTTGTIRTRSYRPQAVNANAVSAAPDITANLTETISVFYTDGSKATNVDIPNGSITANTYAALDTALEALTDGSGDDITVRTGTANPASGTVTAADVVNIALAPTASRNGKRIGWFTFNGGIFASAANLNTGAYAVTSTDRNSLMHSLNRLFADSATGDDGNITDVTVDGIISGSMVTVNAADTNEILPGDVMTYTLSSNAMLEDGREVAYIQFTQTDSFGTADLNAPAAGLFVYPGVTSSATQDLFEPGDKINVRVSSSVVDPAGNSVDSANDEEDDTAS